MILLLQIPEYRVYLQMKCTRINTTLSVIYIHPPGQIIRQATFFFQGPISGYFSANVQADCHDCDRRLGMTNDIQFGRNVYGGSPDVRSLPRGSELPELQVDAVDCPVG